MFRVVVKNGIQGHLFRKVLMSVRPMTIYQQSSRTQRTDLADERAIDLCIWIPTPVRRSACKLEEVLYKQDLSMVYVTIDGAVPIKL